MRVVADIMVGSSFRRYPVVSIQSLECDLANTPTHSAHILLCPSRSIGQCVFVCVWSVVTVTIHPSDTIKQ